MPKQSTKGKSPKHRPKAGGSKAAPTKGAKMPPRHAKPGAKAVAKPTVSGFKAKAGKPTPKPSKPAPPTKVKVPPPPAKPEPAADKKTGRKGITIVAPKPAKAKGKKEGTVIPTFGPGLLQPGSPVRKPLIESGPRAPAAKAWQSPSAPPAAPPPAAKTPFNKRELARFREILVRKRSQLAGDVSTMEDEALRSGSGALSNLPQHMADQGSDAYDQALSLDLAAADRRLIKEIDEAIARIDNGTYGVCELTGKPIKAERLEELPWARYSIEAARELERRPLRP